MSRTLARTSLAILAALAGLGWTAGAARAGTITSGHLDFDIDYSGGSTGALSITWRTANPMSTGTPVDTDDYAMAGNPAEVPLANAYTVPSSSSFACLGTAGSTVYRLKQAQDASQVWLGYNTQGVALGELAGDKVGLELVSVVAAPAGGRFVLYTTNAFGTPTYLFNTTTGSCNRTAFPGGGVSANIHNHAWWAFSAAGTYTLRFAATATRSAANGGGAVSSGNVDVTFVVQ